MDGLSDLELVAQAMAPTEQAQHVKEGAPDNAVPPSRSSDCEKGRTPSTENAAGVQRADVSGVSDPSAASLASLGLSADSLASLTSLMKLSDTDLEDMSDEGIMDILSQMDAADGVADDLEGRLDRLLEMLGGVEGEILGDAAGREDNAPGKEDK
ncbi:hypothetical protein IAU60_002069 [Kwoniella sp. DSM 27419]